MVRYSLLGFVFLLCGLGTADSTAADPPAKRPNILLCIADDWGWPHAPAYGDTTVKTPAFDRLVKEGAVFHNAFVSSPSCTPSRGAILTGQHFWRLGPAANLWSVFPDKLVTYPERLEKTGYTIGANGKNWGPGKAPRPLAGKPHKSFAEFLAQRPKDQPFCFWQGSSFPHRPYTPGAGAKSGIALEKIQVPHHLPDVPEVRGDLADYYDAVQHFDELLARTLAALTEAGELDNTLIVVTGDNGFPFPRGKANVYDLGSHEPLAMRWPGKIKPGRRIDDFVSLTDLAPTFLEVAGVERPPEMTGRSLLPILTSEKSGRVDDARDHVYFGKERHTQSQEKPDLGGYPCRAVRTFDYLYIRNFTPDRWPAGTPDYAHATIPGMWLSDTDNGPSKQYLYDQRDGAADQRRFYSLAFGKRPAEELYDLRRDPQQLTNIAAEATIADVKNKLSAQLQAELQATADPRVIGGAEELERHPYLGGGVKFPGFNPRE